MFEWKLSEKGKETNKKVTFCSCFMDFPSIHESFYLSFSIITTFLSLL